MPTEYFTFARLSGDDKYNPINHKNQPNLPGHDEAGNEINFYEPGFSTTIIVPCVALFRVLSAIQQ
jgi:hypothetical protein